MGTVQTLMIASGREAEVVIQGMTTSRVTAGLHVYIERQDASSGERVGRRFLRQNRQHILRRNAARFPYHFVAPKIRLEAVGWVSKCKTRTLRHIYPRCARTCAGLFKGNPTFYVCALGFA